MLDTLVKAVKSFTDSEPEKNLFLTSIDNFAVMRSNQAKYPNHILHQPALCLVLQGAKWGVFGDRRLDYRAGQALLVSITTPSIGAVCEASPELPYLGLIIGLDLAIMSDVLNSLTTPILQNELPAQSVFVAEMDEPILDCALRAIRLLDRPDAIPTVYPLIMREICYWLLTGPHGGDIVKIALGHGHSHLIIAAIHDLRDRYRETIRIEDLARAANLSPSAFHRQFKEVTSMSPLQYQKQLRLIEARRLLLSNDESIETASSKVGYESPSQFSREYARLFGAPPRRDIQRLKSLAA